jgi:hypothetical protein
VANGSSLVLHNNVKSLAARNMSNMHTVLEVRSSSNWLSLCFLSAAHEDWSTGYPVLYTRPWMRPRESDTSPERTNTKYLFIYISFKDTVSSTDYSAE